jgi:hypothetical protein
VGCYVAGMHIRTHIDKLARSVAVARLKAGWRWIDRLLPYLLTVLFAVGLGVALSHHEMWRDELQAWLLARDAASPLELLHNIRYEGHPGLWHLLLWGPAQLTWNPVAMQVVHGLLASLAVFVVLRFAPFRWLTRILLCGSYFLAYEWAVVSRNYAISMLLFFLFATLHRKRWRWFPLQAVVAFALCHTNIHSIILVLVLLPMLGIEYAVAYAGERADARRQLLPVLLGFLIIVLGVGTGVRQIVPPEDSGWASSWNFTWDDGGVGNTAACMVRAYAPVPVDRPDFWNTNRYLGEIDADHYVPIALGIAGATALLFLCQPWPIIPYVGGTLGLLLFFYVKYPGAMRHHGFLFLLPVVLLWMCWDYAPWRLPWAWANWPSRIWHHLREVPLVALLLLQLYGTTVALKHDWQTPFSMSKATAEWIRREVPDWEQQLLACYGGPANSAVVGHLQAPQIFYANRNEWGSYVIWDSKGGGGPQRGRKNLSAMMEAREQSALLISPHPLRARQLPKAAELLHTVSATAVTESRYHIYRCPLSTTNAPQSPSPQR